ncbi:hypothetical protein KUCAC02_024902, partial [Chaenocephalus aceratus]
RYASFNLLNNPQSESWDCLNVSFDLDAVNFCLKCGSWRFTAGAAPGARVVILFFPRPDLPPQNQSSERAEKRPLNVSRARRRFCSPAVDQLRREETESLHVDLLERSVVFMSNRPGCQLCC